MKRRIAASSVWGKDEWSSFLLLEINTGIVKFALVKENNCLSCLIKRMKAAFLSWEKHESCFLCSKKRIASSFLGKWGKLIRLLEKRRIAASFACHKEGSCFISLWKRKQQPRLPKKRRIPASFAYQKEGSCFNCLWKVKEQPRLPKKRRKSASLLEKIWQLLFLLEQTRIAAFLAEKRSITAL